jgi:hypothetical protein
MVKFMVVLYRRADLSTASTWSIVEEEVRRRTRC